ncbi:MAG: ribonuclease Z [Deferribacteraceae bacterium]|jgi:ribonuclease Z|nr:ribonuclease Z [Deferribacteraceae bacterium]
MFNFTINQLNSPFDDSAFFARNIYRKKAFLFDCGRLGGLSHSEILSLGDIFVSHTHMDHFVGFDRILRGVLKSGKELRIFGPPGFIGNVDGKFRGYTWDLVEDYTFAMLAVELFPDGKRKIAYFSAKNRFVPVLSEFTPGKINLGEGFTLDYEFFDHRTLSVGYRVNEPLQYSVDKEKLAGLGYKGGPWLSELKKALETGSRDREITADCNGNYITLTAAALESELIVVRPPQSVTYITDLAPSVTNMEKAIKFAAGSTLLIIESVFLDEDEEHAVKKNHLTLNRAKEIFLKSGSEYVRFTHFAARYENDKTRFMNTLYDGINGKVWHL